MARLNASLSHYENILALVVAKNPHIAGISVNDVIFGEPVEDLTLPDGRNTRITITGKEGTIFYNTLEVFYRRLTLTEAFGVAEGSNDQPATVEQPTLVLEAYSPETTLVKICKHYNVPEGDISVEQYVAPTLTEPGYIQVSYVVASQESAIYAPGPITQNHITIPIEIDAGNLALTEAELDGFDPVSI